VLTLELSRGLEQAGKRWGSELEGSRHTHWQGQWPRVEAVALALRQTQPASFRAMRVRGRHGETTPFVVLTKVVRLKLQGRQRKGLRSRRETSPSDSGSGRSLAMC
jgi:hypothetical protein